MNNKINPQLKKKPTLRKIEKKIQRFKLAYKKTDVEDKDRIQSLSLQLAELEGQRDEMKASENMKKVAKSGVFKKIMDSTKAGTVFELPDGKKAIRPAKFIQVNSHCFAAPEVSDHYPSSDQLQPFVDAGDYIAIFKSADEKELPIAVPVLWKDIQKSRGQRFRMIELSNMNKKGVLILQAALVRNAVEGIDSELAPEEVIKEYSEAFFESRHGETIAKDISFMTKILF